MSLIWLSLLYYQTLSYFSKLVSLIKVMVIFTVTFLDIARFHIDNLTIRSVSDVSLYKTFLTISISLDLEFVMNIYME